MDGNRHIVDQKTLRQYKKKYNFFETPAKIADKMASLLEGIGINAKILEPSAGLGALIKAVEKWCKFPQIDFCEIQEVFYEKLTDYNHVGTDFMEYNPGSVYDAVIMNPPYKNGLAEKHVDHAWDCLKPGGRMVALVGRRAADFIDDEFYGHVFYREEIKKGFRETSINTYLFLIHKPAV